MKSGYRKTVAVAVNMAYSDGMSRYDGIMSYVTKQGLDWKVRILREPLSIRRSDLVDAATDGVIVHGRISSPLLKALDDCGKPMVVFDAVGSRLFAPRRCALAFVDVDSYAIAHEAVNTFADDAGYVVYGFVGEAGAEWSESRQIAFSDILAGDGRVCNLFPGGGRSVAEKERLLVGWLRRLPKPAAVLAASDRRAADVLSACESAGIRVPEDVAVLGVDDDPVLCAHTNPSLSSIRPDFFRSGWIAAEAMDRMFRGKFCRRHLIVTEVSHSARASTQMPSSVGRLVRDAEVVIRDEALNGLAAADVSRRLRVSRRLLDLRFRQITGRSILETIRAIRLDRAKELAEGTHLPFSEIAHRCAFSSPTNLRRAFRLRFGKTMASCRK